MKKLLKRTANTVLGRFGYSITRIALPISEPQLFIAGSLYSTSSPSGQNAVDIFRGSWSSKFPPQYSIDAGNIQLFDDARISWAADRIGGVQNKTILELGPLEGGHSYMLEQMGAGRVISVEANAKNFLKCLITKEILDLKQVEFHFGDFVSFLQSSTETYDAIIACGVLYHMELPVEVIEQLSRCSDTVFVWTHYYDEQLILRVRNLAFPRNNHSYAGFDTTLYRQDYEDVIFHPAFCGGPATFSHWLERDDLLRCFGHFGFSNIEIGFDEPNHQNGPALAFVARKY